MKKSFPLVLCFFLLLLLGCQPSAHTTSVQTNQYNVIPLPVSLQAGAGTFSLNGKTVLVADHTTQDLATYFAEEIKPATGYDLQITATAPKRNAIIFKLDSSISAPEAYRLSVSPERILITAQQAPGLFYGLQTLRQLLPAEL